MRKYETIFIVQPELADDDVKALTDRALEIVTSMGGDVDKLEDWGTRKLAYAINKFSRGRYFYFRYSGSAAMIAELERRLRLNDKVIRYQSVKLDKADKVAPAAEVKAVEEAPESAEQA